MLRTPTGHLEPGLAHADTHHYKPQHQPPHQPSPYTTSTHYVNKSLFAMAYQFLDEVNRRLDRPVQRKSQLAAYFEAHYEFQEAYRSPSASRSPSPEVNRVTQSAWPAAVSHKRSWSSVDSMNDGSVVRGTTKRRKMAFATGKHHASRLPINTQAKNKSRKIGTLHDTVGCICVC